MLIVLAVDGYATLLERVIGNKIGGISVKRLTSKRNWEEAKSDLKHEMGYSHIWKRLAEIENILGEDYNLDRLKELAEADGEGRCVVLPCKIGDKIYDIQMGKITEKTIISIPFLLSKSVNHLCLHAINIRNAITTIDTENLGKTVFLAREEAEAALEKMKERDKQ